MSINDKEFYIFGEPIQTDIGMVRFLTYKEYLANISECSLISQNVLHIYYQYLKSVDKNNKEAIEMINGLKKFKLIELVHSEPVMYQTYMKLFKMLITPNPGIENPYEQIINNEELFMYHRELIMDMNLLSEEKVVDNPEIQKFIDMAKETRKSNEETSFADIVSAVVTGTNNSFQEVGNMTVYQLYSIYYRMAAIFEYNTSTLFATVSEKVKIESWGKHLDLFKRDDGTIKKDKFHKKFGSML